ncbi:amidohydrolase family protein [Stieleria sp. JC731]|uniref:amidohydrolase family protein n=1 Tax=Pirellulaceae TaxID=2691357 RepID=UPI001E46D8B6|nr:amidohydrolase family protein [Stieleria sp. JC731]MCC9604189.1 amidohydrolase family protein [Stieleria sp. JC731]
MNPSSKTYQARWLFPITGPPIENPCITVVDGIVVDISNRRQASVGPQASVDLGDVAVLPKLVNAHTHLEFSDCRRPIGEPGIALANWIGEVIRARGQADESVRAANIASGLAESQNAGVELIADIATTPSSYPEHAYASIVSFAEVLGLSQERGAERFQAALLHSEASARGHSACRIGESNLVPAISPHAPYSTPIALVQRCVDWAAAKGCPVAMHLAESPDERELLTHGTGRFADSLQRAGLWVPGLFPLGKGAAGDADQPILAYLQMLAEAPLALVVHGNDLQDCEMQFIAERRHMTVVYCPRTHHFFGYDAHPVGKLLEMGVRVALGTDSRASNPDLSIWEELRFLLSHRQDLAPSRVLEMATIMGADSLGRGPASAETPNEGARAFGCIQPGKTPFDSLMMIPTSAQHLAGVHADFAETDTSQLRFCTAIDSDAGHNDIG